MSCAIVRFHARFTMYGSLTASCLSAEAAQIVLDVPIKKTMIPLNVTHTAVLTKQLHSKLLQGPDNSAALADGTLPKPFTNLRYTLSTLISFFAGSYKSTFGFLEGPPLHDALTIGYISRPELFKCQRYRVDVELNGTHTSGETVVDMWRYRSCDNSWGWNGKNCLVAESVDVTIS
jgi:uridine nucleosidase